MNINYNTLVQEYQDSLHTKLRNFAVGYPFLDLWVPDEDHAKSLLALFEAAQMGQVKEPLDITVGNESANTIDFERLKKETERLGVLSVQKNAQGVELSFQITGQESIRSTLNKSESQIVDAIVNIVESDRRSTIDRATVSVTFPDGKMAQINPVYQEALEKAGKKIRHEGQLEQNGKTLIMNAEREGMTLSTAMDADQKVVEARHTGATGVYRILLDELCEILLGRSIQEGSDHGVIRLEHRLRNHTLKRPVPGVVTSENGDPMFAIPKELVRILFHAYTKETEGEANRNFWTDPLSSQWLSLDDSERKRRVQQVLDSQCQRLNLEDFKVKVVGIQNHTRVVLAYESLAERVKLGHNLMGIEASVKEQVEPQLELILETREDKNRREQRNPPPAQVIAASPESGSKVT